MVIVDVDVEYGRGFKGAYTYVICPICGEKNEVDNTDDVILEDTREKCIECGTILNVIWRSIEQKERIRREIMSNGDDKKWITLKKVLR